MKHIKFSIITAAALVSMASCEMADVDKITTETEAPRVLTFDCPVQETRTGLTDLQPFWNSGDEIWVSDGTTSVKAVIPDEFDGLASATVEVTGLKADADLYALYPYDENASISSGKILVEVPAVQDGLFENAHIATALCKAGSDIVEFKNSSAVLKFNSMREEFWTLQLQNITLACSGKYKVDPTTGEKFGATTSLRKIRVNFDSKIGDMYISYMESNLPAGSVFTFITRDGRMGSLKTSQKNDIQNGYLYDLGNIDDAVVLDSEPAEDLSKNESSNCYVVNKGGSYRFKAVRGCSTKSVGDVAYGDVVWETVNTATAPKKFSMATEVAYSNGYMYFRLPENVPDGNVLLSACNKDGDILWSWHIWILKDGFKDQTYPSGAIMIDRNLGALSAKVADPLSNGMLYQWGRKDPLLGSCQFTSAKEMAIAGTATKLIATSAKAGTVEYVTANPTHVVYKKSGDWLQEKDLTLWYSAVKTEYDPCPPGYHVPSYSAYTNMSTGTVVWDESKYGSTANVNGETIWFPACGYRYSADGTLTKVGTAFYAFFDENSSTTGSLSYLATNSSVGISTSSSPHASAFSMRCQKFVSSGEKQYATIIVAPVEGWLRVPSPCITNILLDPITIVWGDGDAGNYVYNQYIYHNYKAAGKYSIEIECCDGENLVVSPVGDTEEIDVSKF